MTFAREINDAMLYVHPLNVKIDGERVSIRLERLGNKGVVDAACSAAYQSIERFCEGNGTAHHLNEKPYATFKCDDLDITGTAAQITEVIRFMGRQDKWFSEVAAAELLNAMATGHYANIADSEEITSEVDAVLGEVFARHGMTPLRAEAG